MSIIREVDRGWKALLRQINAVQVVKPQVEVGVFDPRRAEIAVWNEFGTSRIPARPFLRTSQDKHAGKYVRMLVDAARAGIGSPAGFDHARTMRKLGAVMVGDVQKTIADGVPPPNADSTIAKKGSSKPLIDTGLMRSLVDYRVRS